MVREHMLLAANHGGWQVEIFDPNEPEKGWYPAVEEQVGFTEDDGPIYVPIPPFETEEEAIKLMVEMQTSPIYRKDVELRVYPVSLEKVKK